MSRGYFEAVRGSTAPDLRLKYKELRFLVRFLIVALLLNRNDEVRKVADRFRSLVEESKVAFPVLKRLNLVLLSLLVMATSAIYVSAKACTLYDNVD